MPRYGATPDETVGAALRGEVVTIEELRSPLGTVAPTFQSHFTICLKTNAKDRLLVDKGNTSVYFLS